MKKILSMLLCLTMLSGLFTLPAFAADEEAVVNAKLSELLFIDSDGSAIGEIPNENAIVNVRATVTADGEETVSLYVASYNADGSLKSLDTASGKFTGNSTKIISTTKGVDAKDASRVSAFVWKSDLSPVVERVDLGSQAILLGASITVPDFNYNASTKGDYTFDAVVNNEDKTVTFYIPYTTYSNEINAQAGTSYPGVTPNVNEVKYSLDTVGTASLEESTPKDADELSLITVTSPDKQSTEDYTVEHKFVAVERRINDFASADADGEKLTYSATDVLNGNVYLNQNIEIPSGMVTVDSDKVDFELSNNNKIRFRASQFNNDVKECQRNDHFVMNFSFCIDSFQTVTDADKRFAFANISDVDSLVFVATGDNTFVLNHRKQDDNGKGIRFENCPELETGKWYTYTHVFDKDSLYTNGYKVSGYIDGKYIGSCADYDTTPFGTFDRKKGQDLDLWAYNGSTVEGSFRKFELMSVMGDEKYEGKTTVHILGDSIACYYTSNRKSQQGWGYALSKAFDSSKVRFLNHSVGGYNSNIYLNGANRDNLKSEPIWQSIERYIKPDDYVLIAIGRNETNSKDGTIKTAEFVKNLTTMAEKVKAADAIPVFVTAIPAVSIESDAYSVDNNINFSGDIKAAYDMRNFAAENEYACLDLNAESYHELMDMSSNELKTIFSDKVHITEDGANLIAELLVKLIAENTDCGLKGYLAGSYDDNHAYVNSAAAVIGGKTYIADVNTDSNTITFEEVLDIKKVQDVPTLEGEYSDVSAVSVDIIANGDVAGIDGTLDLRTPQKITVTKGTDKQIYTVSFDQAQYVRTYNADSEKNDDGKQSASLRKYILASETSKGNGGWFAENASSPDGTSQPGYGTIRAEDKVVKFKKTKGGKALNLGSFASDIDAQGKNDKISAQFDIKVIDLSSADSDAANGTLYINSGHLDQILVTRIGAPKDKYFIGYRPNADDGKIFTYTAKPLSFGETYKVKYVFNKDTNAPSGYRMAIYIDGEFITETDFRYRVDTSSEYSVPAGDLTSWPGTATSFGTFVREAQIMIRSFSRCLADVEFDNFVITCIPTTED